MNFPEINFNKKNRRPVTETTYQIDANEWNALGNEIRRHQARLNLLDPSGSAEGDTAFVTLAEIQPYLEALGDIKLSVLPESGYANLVEEDRIDPDTVYLIYGDDTLDIEGGGGVPLSNYPTFADMYVAIGSAVSTKQDIIQDLSDIRQGAQAGSTAVQEVNVSQTDSGTTISVDGGTAKKIVSGTEPTNTAEKKSVAPSWDAMKEAIDEIDVSAQVEGKADKVSGAVSGNFAGLDSNGNLTDSGKKPSDITAIEQVIPSQASSSNQLGDKAFINSSIATATATFRGTFNLISDLHLTISATQAQIATALASAVSGEDNNDYAFVQIPTSASTPAEIARVERYKYNGTEWSFEYSLNNSGFTAAQWEALNSGITSGLVAKLSALPTNAELTTLLNGKQATISDLDTIRSGAALGATAYQKPQAGIPSTDMTSAVQTSLDSVPTIPFAQVDSTSTSTAFTATVPLITELRDGICCMLKNGVVTSATNCTLNVNGLGAKPIYYNMNATRQTTLFNVDYTFLFVYDSTKVSGGAWVIYGGYNSNTNTIGYQIRYGNAVLPVSDTARYYKIYFTSADGTHWVPASANSTNNATSARPVNQRPIDPFGKIVYTSANTNYTAGTNLASATAWEQYTCGLGYSFNRTGAALVLQYPKPVYIKCHPQADGSAIIDADEPYVQALPTTEDGLIYIFLGVAYSATAVELMLNHPVYQYKDGAIKQWTGKIDNLDGMLTDEAEISYRPTAGAFDVLNSGQALLTSIQGRTVSWNQLVPTSSVSKTVAGIPIVCSNGLYSIKGTATNSGGRTSYISSDIVSIVSGHKYYCDIPSGNDGILVTQRDDTSLMFGFYSRGILTASRNINNGGVGFNFSSGKTYDIEAYIHIIDLTLIYGSGNEPTTPEAFEADYEAWFGKPLTYEAYTAGELRNLTATGIKTVGFNQLPNIANPSAQVIGGMQYQLTGLPDDSDDDLITIDGETVELDSNDKFTPSKSGTLLVQGTYPDACLHFVHSGRRDNEYEEHWESTKNLPITTMTGKLLVNGQPSGESVVLAPHGMLEAGSVKDEIRIENGKRYYYKYVGDVDLGTLSWALLGSTGHKFQGSGVSNMRTVSNSIKSSYICALFKTLPYYTASGSNGDNTDCSISNKDTYYVCINSTVYQGATATTFKTAMSGVMLNYELATPEVYLLDEEYQEDSVWSYKCDDWGTEQLVSGTTQSAPMPCKIDYGLNAIDTLRNLPHNYVSATMPQNFTELQKQQARENIGVVGSVVIDIDDSTLATSLMTAINGGTADTWCDANGEGVLADFGEFIFNSPAIADKLSDGFSKHATNVVFVVHGTVENEGQLLDFEVPMTFTLGVCINVGQVGVMQIQMTSSVNVLNAQDYRVPCSLSLCFNFLGGSINSYGCYAQ